MTQEQRPQTEPPQQQPPVPVRHTEVTEPASVPDGIKPNPNQPGATPQKPKPQQSI